jgi:hypothetical protein
MHDSTSLMIFILNSLISSNDYQKHKEYTFQEIVCCGKKRKSVI